MARKVNHVGSMTKVDEVHLRGAKTMHIKDGGNTHSNLAEFDTG